MSDEDTVTISWLTEDEYGEAEVPREALDRLVHEEGLSEGLWGFGGRPSKLARWNTEDVRRQIRQQLEYVEDRLDDINAGLAEHSTEGGTPLDDEGDTA